jgi:aryl-alcohol dehydrogenase-like predicted oxidoreductase
MHHHSFGPLPPVSTLTLGGGGLGMLWGETTVDECIATVHDAVAAGINLLDLAPRYGDGKAEEVVGEAFGGRLPEGVRVTSKCNVGEPLAYQIEDIVRHSIDDSLKRLRLSQLDLFFLHSSVVPDAVHIKARPDAAARAEPTQAGQAAGADGDDVSTGVSGTVDRACRSGACCRSRQNW